MVNKHLPKSILGITLAMALASQLKASTFTPETGIYTVKLSSLACTTYIWEYSSSKRIQKSSVSRTIVHKIVDKIVYLTI